MPQAKKPKYNPDDFVIVKENKKEPAKTIVKRVNITNEFELGDIDKQLTHLDKLKTELTSQESLCGAYMQNVQENYHKTINNLSEEEMHAVNIYYENLCLARDARKKLKEVRKQEKDYKEISKLIETKFGVTTE